MSHTNTRIVSRIALVLIMVTLTLVADGIPHSEAHQDPCHQLHSCPSDHNTYVCGDKGRCDQCPDHQYCLAGKARVAASPSPAPTPSASISSQSFTPEAVTVCFTPGGNCTEQIVNALGEAKSSILVQAYSFTPATIAKALLDAHKRGMQVQVILDESQRSEKYSSADFLANPGVPTTIDANHAISHNKVMITDGETVITGSINFIKAAQEKKRRERADHPGQSLGGTVHRELEGSRPA